ncbi:MAG: FAD-dependent oxidoreductase [Proteobacteria bacterium]|nr:FAD-dependent oxidoreductase [Pseudomonadota bacterium]
MPERRKYPLIIIGGGLSGIAAGIRFARFGQKSIILEKHTIPGGLNSYYFRNGVLLETGLHAMTNYAPLGDRQAPLNRLFRQLKLSRKTFITREQFVSEINFVNHATLLFSNDFNQLKDEVASCFPAAIDQFLSLVQIVNAHDPFAFRPRESARARLKSIITDDLLIDMLLLPLMVYGNNEEHDMDFSQFVIMFRAIYLEGFFRPEGTIKDFLDILLDQYLSFGGEIRYRAEVQECIIRDHKITGVVLKSGESISGDSIVSTIGYPGTLKLLHEKDQEKIKTFEGRVSFMEMIYLLKRDELDGMRQDRTIIFYNRHKSFDYCRPEAPVSLDSGVICYPDNFQGLPRDATLQLRITHLANYDLWKNALAADYKIMKEEWSGKSRQITSEIIGNYAKNIVYQDSFTPLTIEKFTAKAQGSVYGSPVKIKNGKTEYDNLFIAGTDQGYLGIVGAMLSGVTIVNQHVLGKI